MRLRRIALENFRRHRQSVWEVPDGVTAVVGANGAGKSSLLEAIAFALYGPRASRTQKDLVRFAGAAPADSVVVTLDFELAGQAWQVTRELRGKNQEPRAALSIDGIVQVPPGAGSSEQATAVVERALGLDRDGFFQTVVAQQGELDRLARMRPAERRSFVLDMVGIGAVDQAITRARERRNVVKAQFDEAGRNVRDSKAAQDAVQQAQLLHEQAAAAAEAARRAQEVALQAAAASRQALETLQATASAHQAVRADVLLATTQLAQADASAAEAQRQLAACTAASVRLEQLRPTAARHAAALQGYNAAVQAEQAARLRAAGLARLAALTRECEQLSNQMAAHGPLPAPAAIAPVAAALQAARQARLSRAGDVARLDGEQAAVRARLVRIRALDASVACPTCEQPLAASHVVHATADLEAQRTALATQIERARAADQAASAAVATGEAALATAQAADAAWKAESARRDAEAQRLDAKRRAAADGEAALPPDSGTVPDVAACKAALDAASRARDECLQLEAAANAIAPTQALLGERLAKAATARRNLADARTRLAAVQDPGPALDAARKAVAEREAAVGAAGRAVLATGLAAGSAQRDVLEAQREVERAAAARAHRDAVGRSLAALTALVGTAGDGLLDRFKDHLVGRTAPMIQEEAGRLLSRFTQGRYADIVLDDDYEVWVQDGGVRYGIDRFSGGEQDLVHLALRLAISRLLATRAHGAEIRLLALDEVFGGLDPSHRDLVVAALHQLDGMYSQILAITHDEDLQEVLDHAVRIELVDGEARLSTH